MKVKTKTSGSSKLILVTVVDEFLEKKNANQAAFSSSKKRNASYAFRETVSH